MHINLKKKMIERMEKSGGGRGKVEEFKSGEVEEWRSGEVEEWREMAGISLTFGRRNIFP
ncbi:hypothetical protein [Breznakibacter xylanolyticus]|nr:hypothetical protein [Breznakibacter xylanolyticus]